MDRKFKARPTPGGKTRAKLAGVFALVLLISMTLTLVFSELGWEADMTGEKLYTISEHTSRVIDSLDTQVNIYTLYSPGNDSNTLAGLLRTYASSSPHISVFNIDSAMLPANIKGFEKLSELPYGSAIVYCRKTELFRTVYPSEMYYSENGKEYSIAESKITAAIEYVYTGKEYRFKMLGQHREKSEEALSDVLTELSRKNINYEIYDLLSENPAGSGDLILSVSPMQDFSEEEIARLKEFVYNGGTFFTLTDMAEYNAQTGSVIATEPAIPNLTAFLEELGISISSNMLTDLDTEKTGMRPTVIEVTAADSDILGSFAGSPAVMAECTAIDLSADSEAEGLIYTSEKACGHSTSAPYCVAAVCEYGSGRVVAASSSSLLTMHDSLSNSDIISAIMSYCGIEAPAPIDAKPLNPENMTVNHGVVKIFLAILVIAVMPGIVIALGVKILKKRRASDPSAQ